MKVKQILISLSFPISLFLSVSQVTKMVTIINIKILKLINIISVYTTAKYLRLAKAKADEKK